MASQSFEPIHFNELEGKVEGKDPLLSALFLFFLFIPTLLFLYVLYLCVHRRGGGVNPNVPSAGLDSVTLSGLPMFSYSSKLSSPSEVAECAICLSLFQEGDMVKVMPLCSHGFHSDCVDLWLKARSSCPLCRASVHCVITVSRECDDSSAVP